jgi:cyclopropane fatty-acyl-phospholipid synthase-like methyltransferase
MPAATTFDPIKYKQATKQQWENAAEAWHRWGPTLQSWLGPATEIMFDMARIEKGQRVLDVAAGAGEQTLEVAKRIGAGGSVLATDISSKILEFALASARKAGLKNEDVQTVDGEILNFRRTLLTP